VRFGIKKRNKKRKNPNKFQVKSPENLIESKKDSIERMVE
jgi:hypothetical protein